MTDYQIISLIFVFIIAVILYLLWRTVRAGQSYRYFPRVIKKISKYNLKNVLIPDAVEGSSFIDWLVLTPRGILVISQKTIPRDDFCI